VVTGEQFRASAFSPDHADEVTVVAPQSGGTPPKRARLSAMLNPPAERLHDVRKTETLGVHSPSAFLILISSLGIRRREWMTKLTFVRLEPTRFASEVTESPYWIIRIRADSENVGVLDFIVLAMQRSLHVLSDKVLDESTGKSKIF
jgi:hypothetical protein